MIEVFIPDYKLVPACEIRKRRKNPNNMSPQQIAALKRGIVEHGFLVPVVIHGEPGNYELIDGHHRADVLNELGVQLIPAIILGTLAEAEAVVRTIALNHNKGNQDLAMIAEIMQNLSAQENWLIEDLGVTGFTEEEINLLLESVNSDPDELPEELAAMEPVRSRPAENAFVLEIPMRTKEDLIAVRKALRHAAGSSQNMGDGLLSVLGLNE